MATGQTNRRNSSIELLRLLCILGILIMHSTDRVLNVCSGGDLIVVTLITTICNVSSSALMLISGFYGIRFSIQKLLNIEFMLWFCGAVSLLLDFYINQNPIGREQLLSTCQPVLSSKSWFVTGYVVVMVLSPFLNRIPEALSKQDFKKVMCLIVGGIFFRLYFTMA